MCNAFFARYEFWKKWMSSKAKCCKNISVLIVRIRVGAKWTDILKLKCRARHFYIYMHKIIKKLLKFKIIWFFLTLLVISFLSGTIFTLPRNPVKIQTITWNSKQKEKHFSDSRKILHSSKTQNPHQIIFCMLSATYLNRKLSQMNLR